MPDLWWPRAALLALRGSDDRVACQAHFCCQSTRAFEGRVKLSPRKVHQWRVSQTHAKSVKLEEAIAAGAIPLVKPFGPGQLLTAIEDALDLAPKRHDA